MSLGEAEAVLRAAGFRIEPYPDVNKVLDPNRGPDWYGVLAVFKLFKKLTLGHSDIYVLLLPKQPGDYRSVEKAKAKVFVSTL
jgi:hypothetical protein